MNSIVTSDFETPWGTLIIGSYKDKLCLCDWKHRNSFEKIIKRISNSLGTNLKEGTTKVITETKSQLAEYFEGNRQSFDLPIHLVGSDFQKRVWNELLTIPYGKTISYLELSRRLGDEKAIRAVATANGANAMAVVIPCHRIIGKSGKLIGYSGGIKVKASLLTLEKALIAKQLELF